MLLLMVSIAVCKVYEANNLKLFLNHVGHQQEKKAINAFKPSGIFNEIAQTNPLQMNTN